MTTNTLTSKKAPQATRPYFFACPDRIGYQRKDCTFLWHPGQALAQARRNVVSLHEAIRERAGETYQVLEVSTKGRDPLGARLSALNLTLTVTACPGIEVPVENVFQCAKIFRSKLGGETVGPFHDLLQENPHAIKNRIRQELERHDLKPSDLVGFEQNDISYGLDPQEGFYFYLYCWALHRLFTNQPELLASCKKFQAFTDISFNPKKSINCQAAALAFYLSLSQQKTPQEFCEILKSKEMFYTCIKTNEK